MCIDTLGFFDMKLNDVIHLIHSVGKKRKEKKYPNRRAKINHFKNRFNGKIRHKMVNFIHDWCYK